MEFEIVWVLLNQLFINFEVKVMFKIKKTLEISLCS